MAHGEVVDRALIDIVFILRRVVEKLSDVRVVRGEA
jgi:hypothetical protein